MFNFPRVSEVRFMKLSIHSIFIMATLTILTLLSKDLVSLALGHPIEKDISYVFTILFTIWLLFAVQNNQYQKQDSK